MKKLKYVILLFCFMFMISGCTKKEVEKEEVKEPISNSTPLLLEVTKEGSENILYLFGSIHAGEETMYPLPNYVMNAYKKSDIVAVEFDIIEYEKDMSTQLSLASKMMNPDSKTIKDYIDEDTYDRAVEILKDAGLYSPLFDNYNPMMWQSLVENAVIIDINLNTSFVIDSYFLKQAKEDNKNILELESAELQYDILFGFDTDVQVYLLEQSIDGYELSKSSLKQLYEAYKKGDKGVLEKVLFIETEEDNPYMEEYNNQLITVRNINMTTSLEKAFENGNNVFCTIGLAHIIGEGGIADLLEQKGYSIRVLK